MFGVENVAARIYDPRRAEVYQRLGIPTVATVRWTADQMLRRLLPSGAEPLWRDPSGGVQLAEVHTSAAWVGPQDQHARRRRPASAWRSSPGWARRCCRPRRRCCRRATWCT